MAGPRLAELGDDDQEQELEGDGLRTIDPGTPGGNVEPDELEQAEFRDDQRYAIIGKTGSGKSILSGYLWSIYPGQRILVDVNDDYELGPAALADEAGGFCEAEQVRRIDWNARTVRFVPGNQSERLFNDLYAAIWARASEGHGLCVWLDESYGPTDAHRSPRWLKRVLTQGRKRRIMHLACMQEPVNVMPALYSQAEHVALFELAGRPDDLAALSRRFGMNERELALELGRLPKYGYLLSSLGQERPLAMPPLGPGELEQVRRHVLMP